MLPDSSLGRGSFKMFLRAYSLGCCAELPDGFCSFAPIPKREESIPKYSGQHCVLVPFEPRTIAETEIAWRQRPENSNRLAGLSMGAAKVPRSASNSGQVLHKNQRPHTQSTRGFSAKSRSRELST